MLNNFKPIATDVSLSRIGNRQILQAERPLVAPFPLLSKNQRRINFNSVANLTPRPTHFAEHSRPSAYVHTTQSEDLHAVGSMESWRLLLKQLSTLVGSEGSAAIFFHSIGQLGNQFPALRTLSPKQSWPEQLAMVQNTLQPLTETSAAFARQTLWFRGCQLLTKLLGPSLSRRLLHLVAAGQRNSQHG